MQPYYFESIGKTDASTKKTGLRGPIPLTNLTDWMGDSPGSRIFFQLPEVGSLPLTPDEVLAMRAKLVRNVPLIQYAYKQIPQNYLAQRLGIRLAFGFGSESRWTCSETVIRVLPPRVLPYFGIPSLSADDIPPAGYRLTSIESGIRSWVQAEGTMPLAGAEHPCLPCVRIGFTGDRSSLISRLIMRVTAGQASHVLLVFYGLEA